MADICPFGRDRVDLSGSRPRSQQPKSLTLTPTEQFCRMDADDAMVQAKLNELSQARRLLPQVVNNAEQLAMHIAFRVGMHLGSGRLGSPCLWLLCDCYFLRQGTIHPLSLYSLVRYLLIGDCAVGWQL